MTSDNRDTLERFAKYFAEGDLDGVLATLSADAVWDVPGPAAVPYCGTFAGQAGFREFWRLLRDTVDIEEVGFDHVTGEDFPIVALGHERGVVRTNGAPYAYSWAQEYTFTPDHLIAGMRQYFDPSQILEALGARPLPTIPPPFALPFYYASLVHCEVLYLVDPVVVAPYVDGTGLAAARFGDQACAGFNYQLYAGAYNNGGGFTQEVELNIVAYPEHRAEQVALVDFAQFVNGEEQSKILGNHRVWVPCDNDIAIAAGKELFGEPKFKTTFSVDLPVQNAPTVDTWSITVDDPDHPGDPAAGIFTCTAALDGLSPTWSTPSPFTEYGVHEGLIGCRWNVLAPYATYFVDGSPAVSVTYGTSGNPMRADMEALLGGAAPAVIRVLQSAPAAFQSRAYRP